MGEGNGGKGGSPITRRGEDKGGLGVVGRAMVVSCGGGKKRFDSGYKRTQIKGRLGGSALRCLP